MPKNEVAKTEESTPAIVQFDYAGPGISFDDLADEAITLPGHELAKDDEVDALCGVDFIITSVNFREGLQRRESNKWRKQFPDHTVGAYVSLELTTNPVQNLAKINRARKASNLSALTDLGQLGFDPGDSFVINDGSTGIYRKIVAFLAYTGYITLPEGPLEGASGETTLDTIPEEWEDVHVGDVRFDNSGFQTYAANVRLRCKHGIRISEYESEWNPDSKTRYLA